MTIRRSLLICLTVVLLCCSSMLAHAEVSISSPSVILVESTTGKIIYESNPTERRSPASITKIMTLLLTFEALEEGKIHLEDEVITSEYASSMGGSQVFLADGEKQSLETIIKCIVVASGNDASVAMAEHIAGSESAFVEMMNRKAQQLGMTETHFVDCCGLSDSDEHYSCARDVAIMSRELIVHYPQIFDYTGIWMEDITHETKQGTSKFTLSSTNKLLKQYQYTTGLKTGSTSKAKYCISATARKDDIDLIAVVMGAPDPKTRFGDARTLLSYGFSCCRLYVDTDTNDLDDIAVKGGTEEELPLTYSDVYRYLDINGNDVSKVEKTVVLPDYVNAPVMQGEIVGYAVYTLQGKELGKMPIVAARDAEKAGFVDYLCKVAGFFLL